MSYHPRIECPEYKNLLTSRCRESELWFRNNPKLEQAILGYTAKYQDRYGVELFALAIEGNHTHQLAAFPNANRASYMRDLNSSIAVNAKRLSSGFTGGKLWGRRYSGEVLAADQDVLEYFWYVVLQPIKDGLVERLSDYPGYTCFHDAIWGIERRFKVVRWAEYNAAKRYNRKIRITDYTDTVYLKYKRLPGYEHMPQKEYAEMMNSEYERRRAELVRERYESGRGFAGPQALRETPCGSRPKSTKTSSRNSHRPRVLSVCDKRRAELRAWYFSIYHAYKEASARYRAGEDDVEFPPGTYPPWRPAQGAADAAELSLESY